MITKATKQQWDAIEQLKQDWISNTTKQYTHEEVCEVVAAMYRSLGRAATIQRQLAPGTTQGSRHVISGDCKIVAKYDKTIANVPDELIGPAFSCVGDCTIEHPEHGHKILPAETSWAVVYQRAYADEIRRVQD